MRKSFADNRFDELNNINQAIANFADKTGGCIQWVARTNQKNYVKFTSSDSGCYSYVGRIGKKQVSRLNDIPKTNSSEELRSASLSESPISTPRSLTGSQPSEKEMRDQSWGGRARNVSRPRKFP